MVALNARLWFRCIANFLQSENVSRITSVLAGNFIVTLLLACCYNLFSKTLNIYNAIHYGSPFLPGWKEEKRASQIFQYVKIPTYGKIFNYYLRIPTYVKLFHYYLRILTYLKIRTYSTTWLIIVTYHLIVLTCYLNFLTYYLRILTYLKCFWCYLNFVTHYLRILNHPKFWLGI